MIAVRVEQLSAKIIGEVTQVAILCIGASELSQITVATSADACRRLPSTFLSFTSLSLGFRKPPLFFSPSRDWVGSICSRGPSASGLGPEKNEEGGEVKTTWEEARMQGTGEGEVEEAGD
ncbi:hypothetical protein EYF80_018366 [Liparis tanakae]|uniref:Uncharacterized protein n=1 Tax=Liparis tanakae TaxID=230148 RepID=A0A4Z2I0C9_9TELE|nr:hypothetical protein EYF80_018366 [Liparis tanakae]